jgi:hypothetical protein
MIWLQAVTYLPFQLDIERLCDHRIWQTYKSRDNACLRSKCIAHVTALRTCKSRYNACLRSK